MTTNDWESSSNNIGHKLGIERQGFNNFNAINVYKNFESQDFLTTGISYVFFTKPSLHFGDNIDPQLAKLSYYKGINKTNFFRTCPFIEEIVLRKSKMYQNVLNSLKGGFGYIPFITNLAQNFETQDVTTDVTTANDTYRGYKLTLPSTNVESQVGGTFSITFNETRNMEVSVFHKIWSDYIEAIRRGTILPSKYASRNYSRANRKTNGYIDYMCSAYYFLLDTDGKTIKYYSKYTGIFPTNVPFSAFNWEIGQPSLKKVTINYQYNFKEDMNPEILKEFNYVMGTTQNIHLQSVSNEVLQSYTMIQKMENNWKRKPKVATCTMPNGDVNEFLLFDE